MYPIQGTIKLTNALEMNVYCIDCKKYLGMVHALPVCDFVLDSYCKPCNDKFLAELANYTPISETPVNNDADLEIQFRELIRSSFNS